MEKNNSHGLTLKRWHQRPIAWAFIFLLFLISIIFWVSLSSLGLINKEYISYIHIQERKLHLLDEMIHISRQRAVLLRDILISRDPFEKDEIILKHRNLATRYLLKRNELTELPLNLQEKFLINSIIERTKLGYSLQLKIIELSMNEEEEKARKLMTEQLGPNRNEVYMAMLDLRELLVESSKIAGNEVKGVITNSRHVVTWLYIATITLGMLVAWFAYNQFRKGIKKILWQSSHDELTGLLNRQQFENHIFSIINGEINEKYELSLIYIDIDRFNVINNTSGHAAGDELLRQVALTLRECVGKNGTIGRVGGDQFAILMEGTNQEETIDYTKNILGKIHENRFLWRDRLYDITLGIGVLFNNSLQGNLDEIWTSAYISCDLSKEAGGNQYSVYHSDSHLIVNRRRQLAWSTRIKSALTNDNLVLFSQPIKDSDNQSVQNEILIRYQNENGLILSAKNFIPAAERYNIITDIDMYALRKTLEYMNDNKTNEIFSVNLSGSTLGSKTIESQIIKLIDYYKINPELICFEVTETTAISNKTNALKFMNILHGIGCRFSLDDFGSGLSSFGYLKSLPIDDVKIDGFFIQNMETDSTNSSVIEAINYITHDFGLKTIAECVENQAQLDLLKEIGVDYFQGNHLQEPTQLFSDRVEHISASIKLAST
ncbi:putative bifunctional diguanylate cyclase/phosphodiesterase [Kaarinaea lacus]